MLVICWSRHTLLVYDCPLMLYTDFLYSVQAKLIYWLLSQIEQEHNASLPFIMEPGLHNVHIARH